MGTSSERPLRLGFFEVVGAVALVLTLALTSPGVRIAEASDSNESTSVMSVDPALVGPVETPARAACEPRVRAAAPAQMAGKTAIARQQQMIEPLAASRGGDRPEYVVLNNRGYSYSNPLLPRR